MTATTWFALIIRKEFEGGNVLSEGEFKMFLFSRSDCKDDFFKALFAKFRIDDSDIEWDATLIQALGIEMELGVEVTSLRDDILYRKL